MAISAEQKQAWEDNGFLLLEGFYSDQKIDQVNDLISDLWGRRQELDASYVIDIFVESPEEKRVYFADAPKQARNRSYKLNDLFLSQAAIREMVAGQTLAPILRELLEGRPMICNSLNFEFGSQQDYHFDTFYMPSPTPNKMVASWIALENVTDQSGPLTYYPGSHKIPPYNFSSGSTIIVPDEMATFNDYIYGEIEKRGLHPQTLIANKGDVLIWHSQLFHGGMPIKQKNKTRKSLVTHYFTEEDFPDLTPPTINDDSCYMARGPQPVDYEFKKPAAKKWYQRLFS